VPVGRGKGFEGCRLETADDAPGRSDRGFQKNADRQPDSAAAVAEREKTARRESQKPFSAFLFSFVLMIPFAVPVVILTDKFPGLWNFFTISYKNYGKRKVL
jgi:hypothetical protein